MLFRASRVTDLLDEQLSGLDDGWSRAWLPVVVVHLIVANMAATACDCHNTPADRAEALDRLIAEVRSGWEHGLDARRRSHEVCP